MYTRRKRRGFFNALLLILICSSFSISCARQSPGEKQAVVVNNYTITAAEFNELFNESGISENTPKARKNFLDNLIRRKLLLQEAQKEGMDKKKDFLQSIERFWEQSLLKVIIDKKIDEISLNITITEEKITDYYNKWVQRNPDNPKTLDELREPIRQQLMKIEQTAMLNSWIEGLKKAAKIKVDKKNVGIE